MKIKIEHTVELSGEDLADAWVNRMGNTSASIRRVFDDGTLTGTCAIF